MTTTTLLLILFLLLFPFFLLPITTINITSTSIKLEELPKKLHESPKFYVPEKISLREVFLNRKIIVRCATPTRALVYRVIACAHHCWSRSTLRRRRLERRFSPMKQQPVSTSAWPVWLSGCSKGASGTAAATVAWAKRTAAVIWPTFSVIRCWEVYSVQLIQWTAIIMLLP